MSIQRTGSDQTKPVFVRCFLKYLILHNAPTLTLMRILSIDLRSMFTQ